MSNTVNGGLIVSIEDTGATAQQVQGNVASGAADSGNPVKVGGVFQSSLPVLTAGQRSDVQLTVTGHTRVFPGVLVSTAVDGFANSAVGYVGNAVTNASLVLLATAPTHFNGVSWDREVKPSATSRIPSAANTTNATSAKASAGNVHSINAYNTTAAVKYLKVYNKASAPTVGTDTPVMTFALQPNSQFSWTMPAGLYFSTGIAYALTGAAADADTTALTAGDVTGVTITYS